MPAQLSNEELLGLYKIAIQEYRFEVKLNWNRTMYYLAFNSALISVSTALLKLDNPPIVYLLIAMIFLLGFISCLIGSSAVRTGHQYYRRTIVKKTLIEDMLGLTTPLAEYEGRHTLSIGTTLGQSEHLQVLHDTEKWLGRKLRRSSVTFFMTVFLVFLGIINLVGFVSAISLCSGLMRVPRDTSVKLIPTVIRHTTQRLRGSF